MMSKTFLYTQAKGKRCLGIPGSDLCIALAKTIFCVNQLETRFDPANHSKESSKLNFRETFIIL